MRNEKPDRAPRLPGSRHGSSPETPGARGPAPRPWRRSHHRRNEPGLPGPARHESPPAPPTPPERSPRPRSRGSRPRVEPTPSAPTGRPGTRRESRDEIRSEAADCLAPFPRLACSQRPPAAGRCADRSRYARGRASASRQRARRRPAAGSGSPHCRPIGRPLRGGARETPSSGHGRARASQRATSGAGRASSRARLRARSACAFRHRRTSRLVQVFQYHCQEPRRSERPAGREAPRAPGTATSSSSGSGTGSARGPSRRSRRASWDRADRRGARGPRR